MRKLSYPIFYIFILCIGCDDTPVIGPDPAANDPNRVRPIGEVIDIETPRPIEDFDDDNVNCLEFTKYSHANSRVGVFHGNDEGFVLTTRDRDEEYARSPALRLTSPEGKLYSYKRNADERFRDNELGILVEKYKNQFTVRTDSIAITWTRNYRLLDDKGRGLDKLFSIPIGARLHENGLVILDINYIQIPNGDAAPQPVYLEDGRWWFDRGILNLEEDTIEGTRAIPVPSELEDCTNCLVGGEIDLQHGRAIYRFGLYGDTDRYWVGIEEDISVSWIEVDSEVPSFVLLHTSSPDILYFKSFSRAVSQNIIKVEKIDDEYQVTKRLQVPINTFDGADALWFRDEIYVAHTESSSTSESIVMKRYSNELELIDSYELETLSRDNGACWYTAPLLAKAGNTVGIAFNKTIDISGENRCMDGNRRISTETIFIRCTLQKLLGL